MLDTASIHSSPSHQPIALPIPPNFSTKKKDRSLHLKRQMYTRKPPPRVESTQPRETSPELSSSGEETAGDERLHSAVDPPSGEPPVVPSPSTTDVATEADDNGDWVDEDEDDDYEDLIDLEYHPAFVKNISKRRRKWEVGWENLIQAVSFLSTSFFCGDRYSTLLVPSSRPPNGCYHGLARISFPYYEITCSQVTIHSPTTDLGEFGQYESNSVWLCPHGRSKTSYST